jgi:hypothetical protein
MPRDLRETTKDHGREVVDRQQDSSYRPAMARRVAATYDKSCAGL